MIASLLIPLLIAAAPNQWGIFRPGPGMLGEDNQTAAEVTIADAGACYDAETVEEALDELADEIALCTPPDGSTFWTGTGAGFRLLLGSDIDAIAGIDFDYASHFGISLDDDLGTTAAFRLGLASAYIDVNGTRLTVHDDGTADLDGSDLATVATDVTAFAAAETDTDLRLAPDGAGGVAWAATAGGGIGGSTGATDDALLCADGTGGATIQPCNGGNAFAGTLLGPAAYPAITYGFSGDPYTGIAATANKLSIYAADVTGTSAVELISALGNNLRVDFGFAGVRVSVPSATDANIGPFLWGENTGLGRGGANDLRLIADSTSVLGVTSALVSAYKPLLLTPTSTVPTCAEGTSYYDAGDHDFCDCVGSSPAWRSRGGAGDCNGT